MRPEVDTEGIRMRTLDRLTTHRFPIAEADRAGRWASTDPRCKRLSALLKTVRTERQATEQERERRQDAGRPSVKVLDASSRSMQSNDLGRS